jgi:hypothetical protein
MGKKNGGLKTLSPENTIPVQDQQPAQLCPGDGVANQANTFIVAKDRFDGSRPHEANADEPEEVARAVPGGQSSSRPYENRRDAGPELLEGLAG